MLGLVSEIKQLKQQKIATILAHYYHDGDIQDLADFTADSLKLARAATTVSSTNERIAGFTMPFPTALCLVIAS